MSELLRVLVVDDESEICSLLSDILSEMHVSFATASDGEEAIKKCQNQVFHAIVTDLNMPKMTGIEFLYQLRKLSIDTPVILMTAFGDKETVIEALRFGATEYIEKPFEPEEFSQMVYKVACCSYHMANIESNVNDIMAKNLLSKEQLEYLQSAKRGVLNLKYGRAKKAV